MCLKTTSIYKNFISKKILKNGVIYMIKNIKAILLDLDNTIMDFEMITNKGYEYVEIIAKDIGKHIKSFGLDELKLKSNEYN